MSVFHKLVLASGSPRRIELLAAGRHRAGPAAAGRCRRDAAAGRASALACQAAVARKGGAGAGTALKSDGETGQRLHRSPPTRWWRSAGASCPRPS